MQLAAVVNDSTLLCYPQHVGVLPPPLAVTYLAPLIKTNRYIKAWDIEDGAKESLTWGTYQQLDCLASLDVYTAAAVLTRAPDALRKDLLGMLEPYVAANIMQVRGCGCCLRHGGVSLQGV